jgi:hypothetical protein
LRLARAIVGAMVGVATFAKPAGSPQMRSVIAVVPPGVSFQLYVVSIGNGPSDLLGYESLAGHVLADLVGVFRGACQGRLCG